MKHLTQYVAKIKAATGDQQTEEAAPVKKQPTHTVALYGAMLTLTQRVINARGRLQDFANTHKLRDIVSTEGLSRGLVAFVNADGSAEKLFSNFPALESLDTVAVPKDSIRTKNALQGMDSILALEADATNTDLKNVIAALMATMKAFCDDLDAYEDQGEDLVKKLTGATVDAEKLAAAEVMAVSAEMLKKKFESLTAVGTSMATAPNFAGLDADGVKAMKDGMAAAVDMLKDFTGLVATDGEVMVDNDAVVDDHKPTSGKMTDKGYNVESVIALLNQMLATVDVFENVRDNLEAIEAGFMTAVPATAEADAASEPATEAEGDGGAAGGDEAPKDGEAPKEGEAAPKEGEEAPKDGEAADPKEGEGEAAAKPEPATEADICVLVCSCATLISAVINSTCSSVASVCNIAGTMVELAGAGGTPDEAQQQDASEPPPADPAPAEEPPPPAAA